MLSTSIRLWYCAATAIIAAAIADPCVEFASNSGWFGPGRFTDRSNLDVVPALLVGLAVIACYVGMRIREVALGLRFEVINRRMVANHAFATDLVMVLLRRFPSSCWSFLRWKQQSRQLSTVRSLVDGYGSAAPVIASLTAHGLFCILTALALATLLYRFERNAGRVAHFILYAGRRSREAYALTTPSQGHFRPSSTLTPQSNRRTRASTSRVVTSTVTFTGGLAERECLAVRALLLWSAYDEILVHFCGSASRFWSRVA